jgi:hypothetical protein
MAASLVGRRAVEYAGTADAAATAISSTRPGTLSSRSARWSWLDFPDEQAGETVWINPAMVTHMIEVGRKEDKYTEIFVVGGARITVHAAVNNVKTKLKLRS